MNIAIPKITPITFRKVEINKPNSTSSPVLQDDHLLSSPVPFETIKAQILSQKDDEERFFKNFLKKDGKLTREEYLDIKNNHPSIIMKAGNYCNKYNGDIRPIDLAQITLKIDEYFKNKYKNYRIISIGTSPAPITEQLANMGNDVVFLPVSGIRCLDDSQYKNQEYINQMELLMHYLESKNINDGKLNLVLDYASSGKTLGVLTDAIKQYFMFPFNQIQKLSLSDVLFSSGAINNPNAGLFYEDIRLSFIDEISNVPHFPINISGEIVSSANAARHSETTEKIQYIMIAILLKMKYSKNLIVIQQNWLVLLHYAQCPISKD